MKITSSVWQRHFKAALRLNGEMERIGWAVSSFMGATWWFPQSPSCFLSASCSLYSLYSIRGASAAAFHHDLEWHVPSSATGDAGELWVPPHPSSLWDGSPLRPALLRNYSKQAIPFLCRFPSYSGCFCCWTSFGDYRYGLRVKISKRSDCWHSIDSTEL